MPQPVLVAGARTPIGKLLGALSPLSAPGLGAIAVAAAQERAGIGGDQVDAVILGNVVQAGAGPNPARLAAARGGIPMSVPATTVNKLCLSGLTTIAQAAQQVASGYSQVVVAGGIESMSNAPHLMRDARRGCVTAAARRSRTPWTPMRSRVASTACQWAPRPTSTRAGWAGLPGRTKTSSRPSRTPGQPRPSRTALLSLRPVIIEQFQRNQVPRAEPTRWHRVLVRPASDPYEVLKHGQHLFPGAVRLDLRTLRFTCHTQRVPDALSYCGTVTIPSSKRLAVRHSFSCWYI